MTVISDFDFNTQLLRHDLVFQDKFNAKAKGDISWPKTC
jgi:hypothetical protein